MAHCTGNCPFLTTRIPLAIGEKGEPRPYRQTFVKKTYTFHQNSNREVDKYVQYKNPDIFKLQIHWQLPFPCEFQVSESSEHGFKDSTVGWDDINKNMIWKAQKCEI